MYDSRTCFYLCADWSVKMKQSFAFVEILVDNLNSIYVEPEIEQADDLSIP
jgi:hypothetical protein